MFRLEICEAWQEWTGAGMACLPQLDKSKMAYMPHQRKLELS
jgi:hypothetical protein